MEKRIWDDILSDVDKKVIETGGYGKKRGLGKKCAIIVIDAQYNYVGEDKHILEQLNTYPSGCGENAWRAIEKIEILLEKAREKKIPIIFTRNVQKNLKFDSFSKKTERDQSRYLEGYPSTNIVEKVGPKEGELVLDKSYPSAFFGTPLISWLIKLGVDTLIIVGGTTSGCVRATVVDAVSMNFNVAVVEGCTFDRIGVSHKASLLDIWMKYADVINLEEALNYLNKL